METKKSIPIPEETLINFLTRITDLKEKSLFNILFPHLYLITVSMLTYSVFKQPNHFLMFQHFKSEDPRTLNCEECRSCS